MRSQLLYLVLERSFCTWKGTSRYIVLDLSAKLVYSRGGIDQQTTRVKNNNNKLVELSSTPNFLSLSFVGTVPQQLLLAKQAASFPFPLPLQASSSRTKFVIRR
jgi:hypothetical protein